MGFEGPKFPGNNVVPLEAARVEGNRKIAQLAESREGIALAEGESAFVNKWCRNYAIGTFLNEMRNDQEASENRAGLYALVALGGIGAAVFGLPQRVQGNLSTLIDPHFSTPAEIATQVAGVGDTVAGVLESVSDYGEYFRKGRRIREGEQSTDSGQALLA